MSTSTTTMTVTVPAQMEERLERLARAMAQSKAELAQSAIQAFIELHEWQISEIEAGQKEADAGEFATDAEVAEVFTRWTHDR